MNFVEREKKTEQFNEVHIGVNFVVHDYLSLFYIVREHPNMHLKFDSYEASLWLTLLQFSVYGIFTKKGTHSCN